MNALSPHLRRIREQEAAAARRRGGNALAGRDAQKPGDWKVRVRPQGNLRNGLTGVRVEAKKRF